MRTRELHFAWFLFFALAGAFAWDVIKERVLAQVPYRVVGIDVMEVQDRTFNLVADIQTTDCIFMQLSVRRFDINGVHPLQWRDNDGLGQNHIRIKGNHTVRISADVETDDWDAIEVLTRHRCNFELDENGDPVGGEIVDRTLARLEVTQ